VQPKVEPEIVLHLASAPRVDDDLAALFGRIDWIAHGFEIVQCPYPGWKMGVADAIAASGLHGCLVLGERVPASALGPDPVRALADFTLTLFCDGAKRDAGSGANVLGNPLAALAHVTALAVAHPPRASVSAGELISTGTLTAAFDVEPGQTWHTALQGIELPGLALALTG
jgi:2-oxo-3-hexenedioate decarboxylase